MINKSDVEFVAKATDPARRSAEIAGMTKMRNVLLLGLSITTVILLYLWSSEGSKPATKNEVSLALSVALCWVSYSILASQLKLLRVIERLSGNERPRL